MAKTTTTMLRKLYCNQTFWQATNARRKDAHTVRHSPGRIHKHTPRVCRLCCLLQAPRSFSLSVGLQPVCVWAGGVLSVGTKCIRCALVCAVGQIWREIITRRKLPRRCCENSIATKLCLQATNARRTERHTDRHSPGRIHTHLASLACVVRAPCSYSLSVRPQPFRPCLTCLPPTAL